MGDRAMQPTLPYWFKMRQGKAEPAGDNVYRLTAPNLAEAFIAVRPEGESRWTPLVRSAVDGPERAVGAKTYDSIFDAWYAAFELYRNTVVI
jgi:hypothetical protein